jgi:hypothetical protein
VPSPLAELLGGLGDAFALLGVRWYLFGAQAAILHGAARLSADVDVTARLGEVSLGSLLAAVEARGFEPRVESPERFAEETRVLPLVHRASQLPVDVVLAGPGLEERFLARAELREIEGIAVPLASREDLVVMKLLAGRPKDLEDVAALATGSGLDLGYLRATLGELERAIDRSDLLPLLEGVLGRARS